jgi:hypothetical protein
MRDDYGEYSDLFWYKKDAEAFALEFINSRIEVLDAEQPPFKSLKPALKWLEVYDDYAWEIEQVTVKS